jgi:tetratricopeptide (TPR) repeat protein
MLHPQYPQERLAQYYATLIQTITDCAEIYYYLGRLDDALKVLNAGMQLLDQREMQPRDQARLLLELGKIQVTMIFLADGDFDTSMVTLARARQIAESTQDRQQLGLALNLIGQAHYFNNLNSGSADFDTPRDYFQPALEHSQAAGDTQAASDSLFHIGLMHERQQQYDSAIGYYQRVIELADQHDYKREKSYAVRHLGAIYLGRGELDRALRYFEESLALREAIGLKIYLPFAHIAVGDVLFDQQQIAAALVQYQKAYALSDEMKLNAGLIASLLSLGYAHKEQQHLPQAQECFEKAHAIAESIGFQRGMAAAAAELAELAKQGNDADGRSP